VIAEETERSNGSRDGRLDERKESTICAIPLLIAVVIGWSCIIATQRQRAPAGQWKVDGSWVMGMDFARRRG
jgi:hypothetical protein